MVIRFFGGSISINDAAIAIRGSNTPSNGPTNFKGATTTQLLSQFELATKELSTYNDVRREVAAGHPVIILVNNNKYRDNSPPPYSNDAGEWWTRNHIVVVTGYDTANVYINDPLRSSGDYPVPLDMFKAAASTTDYSTGRKWFAISVFRP
jgi:uncharacterized protein YvpB